MIRERLGGWMIDKIRMRESKANNLMTDEQWFRYDILSKNGVQLLVNFKSGKEEDNRRNAKKALSSEMKKQKIRFSHLIDMELSKSMDSKMILV